jgi:hypothetical protein
LLIVDLAQIQDGSLHGSIAGQPTILYHAEVAVTLAVLLPVCAAQEHRKQQNARLRAVWKGGRSSLSCFQESHVGGKRLTCVGPGGSGWNCERQAKFTLDISAAGRIGTVVVNTDAGAKVQTLTCDLFRDWGAPIGVDQATTESVFNYHDKSFVSGLKTTDLDFDGMPDILAPRDFGAKWVTYCVWHFDPNQGRFIQDALSRQMEDLVNLTVDAERRQIVTFTIGPIDPMRDEYRIDSRSVNQYAQRRLLAVRSCVLDTGRAAGAARTASVVTYLNGQEVVQRRTVSADCNDVCGDGCPSVSGKR